MERCGTSLLGPGAHLYEGLPGVMIEDQADSILPAGRYIVRTFNFLQELSARGGASMRVVKIAIGVTRHPVAMYTVKRPERAEGKQFVEDTNGGSLKIYHGRVHRH